MLPLLDKKQGKKHVIRQACASWFRIICIRENGPTGGVGQRLRHQYLKFPFLDEKQKRLTKTGQKSPLHVYQVEGYDGYFQ